MEIQQARYFVALCEVLNFTRAAERCNVTQPSLTRAIKLLEEELGGPLFNRERNRTHLTELGQAVEPHLRALAAQAQAARSRATAFGQLRRTRLKVGVTHGLPLAPLDAVLRRYAASHPETEIELHDGRAAALCLALRAGELEVIVLPRRSSTVDDLHYHSLAALGLRVVVPAGHPLAALRAVPLAALAGHQLVCGAGCQFWEAAEAELAGLGIELRPRFVAGSPDWLHELVLAGLGAGLTAGAEGLPPGLVSRPVEAPTAERSMSLATKRGRLYSPPVKAFVELALQARQPYPAAVATAHPPGP